MVFDNVEDDVVPLLISVESPLATAEEDDELFVLKKELLPDTDLVVADVSSESKMLDRFSFPPDSNANEEIALVLPPAPPPVFLFPKKLDEEVEEVVLEVPK